jgi:hypothetical protein
VSLHDAPTITPFEPTAPDADWETVRARLMARLRGDAPEWTDHNPADPGVTLAEVAAFGLADLHYRVDAAGYDGWPLDARGWQDKPERHWHAVLPTGALAAIADALAGTGPTSALALEPLIRDCRSRADAHALLARAPWSDLVDTAHRPAVASLMRVRLVRQIAHEHADLVAAAVARAREQDEPAPVRDRRAAAELALALPLWEDEIAALVRRERRRLSRDVLLARVDEVRAATAVTADAVRSALVRDGLDEDEARIAMAVAEQPVDLLPEALEDEHGRTAVWPPHPVQALTCEPVTADDYARRARSCTGVRRAWVVRGRHEGVAWNGLPVGDRPGDIPVDAGAPAHTLVVERVGVRGRRDDFLREVLRVAIGPEVHTPFPEWREDLDDLEPRRMICDEVGAGLLAQGQVLVQATLVTHLAVDRQAMVDDARRRIGDYFAAGRPESRPPALPDAVEGPWPRHDQPVAGWMPGEPIRFSEVVDALTGNTEVWGVEKLAMKLAGDADFRTPAAGDLRIPANAVPVLAPARCIRVRFVLPTECGDA